MPVCKYINFRTPMEDLHATIGGEVFKMSVQHDFFLQKGIDAFQPDLCFKALSHEGGVPMAFYKYPE